jgi:hypothetical protein
LSVCAPRFGGRDEVQRAVRELTATGLIHRMGELILPTRSAVRFYTLIEGEEI